MAWGYVVKISWRQIIDLSVVRNMEEMMPSLQLIVSEGKILRKHFTAVRIFAKMAHRTVNAGSLTPYTSELWYVMEDLVQ